MVNVFFSLVGVSLENFHHFLGSINPVPQHVILISCVQAIQLIPVHKHGNAGVTVPVGFGW